MADKQSHCDETVDRTLARHDEQVVKSSPGTGARRRRNSGFTLPEPLVTGVARRDPGSTLIEILIAIVLLGGVVGGTLATLRATILSGTVQRDHAKAHAWLQSSSDVLYGSEKVSCKPSESDVSNELATRTAYDAIVKDLETPDDWKDWQMNVVQPVLFWNAGNLDADPDVDLYFGAGCDPSLTLQLIELEVRSPSGRIIESVEIVK
jgi:hypothetical protein